MKYNNIVKFKGLKFFLKVQTNKNSGEPFKAKTITLRVTYHKRKMQVRRPHFKEFNPLE